MNKKLIRLLACVLCCMMMCGGALAADYENHVLTDKIDAGTCTKLIGDVELTILFVDVPGAEWDSTSRQAFKKMLAEAGNLLQEQAAGYGAELTVTRKYYNVTAEDTVSMDDSEEWVDAILDNASFLASRGNDDLSPSAYMGQPIIFCLNTGGRAFAHSSMSNLYAEYAVLFDDADTGVVRHELMHLFGSKDYYSEPQIRTAAKELFPDSLMLDSDPENVVDELTAYLIGWTNKPGKTATEMLEKTAHLTEEDIQKARENEVQDGYGEKVGDGYVYVGMMEDGFQHGYGTTTWDSGIVYMGDWVWGVRHGKGTIIWEDGDMYTGDFVDGERTGKGTYTWNDGTVYTGDYINGERTGTGSITWSDGGTYTGEFKDSEITGTGVYTWENGTVYAGDFVDGARNGYGVMTYGSLTSWNGDVYAGEFKDNEFHGKGTYNWANGNSYTGEYKNGMKHGWGVYTWASGDQYIGEFVEDVREGQGTYIWTDGAFYTGGFVGGKRSGYGVYYSENGKVTAGQWKDGEYVGK